MLEGGGVCVKSSMSSRENVKIFSISALFQHLICASALIWAAAFTQKMHKYTHITQRKDDAQVFSSLHMWCLWHAVLTLIVCCGSRHSRSLWSLSTKVRSVVPLNVSHNSVRLVKCHPFFYNFYELNYKGQLYRPFYTIQTQAYTW